MQAMSNPVSLTSVIALAPNLRPLSISVSLAATTRAALARLQNSCLWMPQMFSTVAISRTGSRGQACYFDDSG